MQNKLVSIIYLIIIFSHFCGCVPFDRLQPLIELGKNEKLKQKAYAQETDSFERVKNYIQSEKIKEILSKDAALKTFGEPVVIFPGDTQEKWVYKAAESSWFGGEKIYLFFDKQGNLINRECFNSR